MSDIVSETVALTAHLAGDQSDPGILKVVFMGLGVVFVGLIMIIIICKLMTLVGRIGEKAAEKIGERAAAHRLAGEKPDGAVAAAIGAAIAEENGTDVSGIKIVSIKKVAK
jgi:Na+-transporting methylmalonyl-CoA/oxaloacetate decarboxylase gamma subunit